MKFSVVDCDLGVIVLFARANRLSRLDVTEASRGEVHAAVTREYPDAVEDAAPFGALGELLRRYAKGNKTDFLVPVDLTELNPFTARVLTEIRNIPYGKTASYGMIARKLGVRSPRAVGQALKRNPIPIVVPCHRVVRAGGLLGGFGLGLDMKENFFRSKA